MREESSEFARVCRSWFVVAEMIRVVSAYVYTFDVGTVLMMSLM